MIGWIIHRLRTSVVTALVLSIAVLSSVSYASPFGQGVFGADVPFGSATSISIAISGDPTVSLVANGAHFEGTGAHSLTVTSLDVVGYRLYIYSPGTSAMVNGSDTIPASNNTSAGVLAVDSWGYNTDGSATDFIGTTTAPVILKEGDGPYKNGDSTIVTYGVKAGSTKAAGQYTAAVVYTAVAKSQ